MTLESGSGFRGEEAPRYYNPPTTETPETASTPNPYLEAGYKTGDTVLYQHDNGMREILDLEIADSPSLNPVIGAWLVRYGQSGESQRVSKSPSTHPERCRRYSYNSKPRALESYRELMTSSALNSKEKLFDLFDAMARSGVAPVEVGVKMNTDAEGMWTRLKQIIGDIEAGTVDTDVITRDYKLRNKVTEILGVITQPKPNNYGELQHEENVAPRRIEIKIPETQNITDPEKAVLFEQLNIGDEIIIAHRSFRKIDEDSYMKSQIYTDSNQTMSYSVESRNDMVTFINLPFLKASDFKIIKKQGKDLPTVLEDPKKLQKLHEDFKKIRGTLFPLSWLNPKGIYDRIKDSEIKQGQRGDCYLLAAINSIKKVNPHLYYETLARSVKKGEKPGEWEVCFLGMEGDAHGSEKNPIKINESDIEDWKDEQKVEAELADIIIERAYASLKSRNKYGEQGMTMRNDWKGKIALDGGHGHRALHDILGSDVASKYIIANYETKDGSTTLSKNGHAAAAKKFLQNQYLRNPERYIVTAATPYEKDGQPLNDRRYEMYNKKKIHYKHEFSVTGFKGNQLQIENPHDTSGRFWMDLEDFLNYFSQLSYVEIKANYQE